MTRNVPPAAQLRTDPAEHVAQLFADNFVGTFKVPFRQMIMHPDQRPINEAHLVELGKSIRAANLRPLHAAMAIIRNDNDLPYPVSRGVTLPEKAQAVIAKGQHRVIAHVRNLAANISRLEPRNYPASEDVPMERIYAEPDAWWSCDVYRAGKFV